MSNFACLKKQGPGCIWDWPYPLTKVLSEIRIHTFRSDSSRHKASNVSFLSYKLRGVMQGFSALRKAITTHLKKFVSRTDNDVQIS